MQTSMNNTIYQNENPLNGEFEEQIIDELITEGYSDEELLIEFQDRQSKIRPAVESMIDSAKKALKGIGEYYTYDEVFNKDNL